MHNIAKCTFCFNFLCFRNFPCNVCTAAFKSKSELKGHMSVHSDDKPFKCNLCPADFKYKGKLMKHMFLKA